MSSIFRGIATVASIISIVAPNPITPIIAAVATVGATITQKRPPVPGLLNEITIGANQLTPYAMGRTYPTVAKVHEVGWGGEVDDVPNPYLTHVYIISGGGPIEGIEAIQADFTTISFDAGSAGMPAGEATGAYYANFLWADSQLGECPESDALTDGGTIPGFGSGAKLSGKAAFLVTMKFDKKQKRWASGVPRWGAVVNGVLVYDQRQDDTYEGGEGDVRALDEDTYVGGAAALNPSCHAVTYALGRWQGAGTQKKVFGCGMSADTLDWDAWTDFANTCDANGWTIGGTIFEPTNRWENLKRICQAGGGKPVMSGGLLSVVFPRPRVALTTITGDDIVGEISIPAMKGWRERLNGIVPAYPSEDHNWEIVQSDLITVSSYVTADGEEKNEERTYELVPEKDQAAQLAAYDLVNGRELGPIVIPCKPRLLRYKIGDAVELDLPDEGLPERLCVITDRRIDPMSCTIELTLETEDTAKHDFALGRTGTAPPTPSLPTPEEMDDIVSTTNALTNFENMPIMPDVGPITVQADYTGTILTGQLPKNVAFKRYNGATDVTTSAAWSLTVLSGDIDATVGAATGIVEITDVVANGVIEVTSALNGVTASRRVPVSKAIAEPPASSGGGSDTSFDSTILATAQNTYSPINAGPLTLTCGAGGEIECAAPLAITPDAVSPNGTEHAYGKWEISPAGAGTWSDVDTEIQSDVAAVIINEGGGVYSVQDGAITVNQTATSLTPGNDYDLRLRLRNNSGTRTLYYTGTASITTD